MRWPSIFLAPLTVHLSLAVAVEAQQPARTKIPRVGILSPAENDRTPVFEAFRQGLRDHGYVEGSDVILEFRLARGNYGALPTLVSELVALPVDVILTDGDTSVAQAAIKATRSIPIVMATSADPVGQGFVASLARPGGNVTGFTLMTTELSLKRLELLQTAVPDVSTVTVLLNPSNHRSELGYRAALEAAPSLRFERLEAATPEALLALRPEAIKGAVLVLPDAMFWNRRKDIVGLISAARAAALYPEREYADVGGLIAYGPNVPDNFRRAAGYVHRIIIGEKAADLPVQQPAKFEFVVNLEAAKALGLTIPPTLLARADEVIE
jgi:putative tryptophan/tyrosine transport system substrate-binding protein